MQVVKLSSEEFAVAAAERIFTEVKDCQTELMPGPQEDNFRLGLTGGSTAAAVYAQLGRMLTDPIEYPDWSAVDFILTDERAVPKYDENSNWGMIEATLFNKLGVNDNQKFVFQTDLADPVAKMTEQLCDLMRHGTPLFDLLVLGVGPDGHIASLFPGDDVDRCGGWSCSTQTDAFAVKDRYTLSLSALSSAAKVMFILQGEEKREIFNKMQEPGSLPVQRLIDRVGKERVEIWLAN